MNTNPKTAKFFSWAVITMGIIAYCYAVVNFEVYKADFRLVALIFFIIFPGIVFRFLIPHTEIHFSLAKCAVFYATVMYSPSIAVILSLFESFNIFLTFRRKGIEINKQIIVFNISASAIATLVSGLTAWHFFPNELQSYNFSNLSVLIGILAIISVIQFAFSWIVIALFTSVRNLKSFWIVCRKSCLDTSRTFIIAGIITGLVIKASEQTDPFLLLAVVVAGTVSFMIYRQYTNDIRRKTEKEQQTARERAEQAEQYIEELQHYIREQERANKELRESREIFRHAAFHDSLTNLPNRNLFLEKLKLNLEKLKHQPKKKFAVLSLDLNRFKNFNESSGHSIGDLLILHIGRRLSGLIREDDVVARFSGDEFGIILNNVQTADDAIKFAEIIQRKILEPFTIAGRQVFTSVSIGIALGNSNYEKAEDILRDADIAMYHAKEQNKDYLLFNQTMHTRAVTLHQLETDLRHAIDRKEMLVYYQPIVDLTAVRLIGFEALMRWNHSQRGMIPPQ